MQPSGNNYQIQEKLRPQLATIITLVAGLLLTLVAVVVVHRLNEQHIRQAVIKNAEPQFNELIERVNRYRYGLYEARTAVLSSGGREVTDQGFVGFAQSLNLSKDFPGARGFGFIRRVPHQKLADYLAEERVEGRPDFRISYIGLNQHEHYIIEYMEPATVSSNANIVGLDIASEYMRKLAADNAMLSGDAVITSPLTLKYSSPQEPDAFFILLPIYDGAKTPATAMEKMQLGFGWAFAPLNVHEILAGSGIRNDQLILSLQDATNPQDVEEFYRNSSEQGLYPYSKDIPVLGRIWRFTLTVTPAWVAGLNLVSPVWIALLGGGMAVILAMLVNIAVSRNADRKRLLIEQNKLTLIVESSVDAIIGKDTTGTVISWNKGAERMFGYTRQEAIGQKMVDLIIPARLKEEENQILQRVMSGQAIESLETVRHRKDGSELTVATTIAPICSVDGKVIGASKSVRDISLQKEAEQRIRDLNLHLEQQVRQRTEELATVNAMLSTVLSATYEFMIIATDLDGTIRLFNRGAERMLGYREADLVGKATPEMLHVPEETLARGKQLSEQYNEDIQGFDVFIYHARNGRPEHFEWTYQHKDGTRFPVNLVVTAMRDANGAIIGYLGIAADITQQRQAQQALEAARDQLLSTTQTLLIASKTAELGIWSWNIATDGLEWNDKMYELYDLPPSLAETGLTFQHWVSRIHPEDVDIAVSDLRRSIVTHDEYLPTFRILRSDNSQHFIQAAANIEYDSNGQPIRVTGINQDITEDRLLKLHLIEAKEQADAANAAKSLFLANMSHEIRTPMNAVLGMLQLLLKTGLTQKQHDFAFKAHVAATSLLSLLNDVLDYSKIDAGKLELDLNPLDLHGLMQQLAIILSGNLRNKSVELLFDLDNSLPPNIIGDAQRLQQILINLVSNAVKFTEKGEVVVQTRLLALSEQSVDVRISVSDTGIGISEAQQKRIFDVFTQAETSTSRRYGGTGLGLVISRRLVEQMGGVLTVDSELGRGSTFAFELHFPRDTRVSWQPLHVSGDTPRVLVVDDNLIARTLIEDTLRAMHVQVDSTPSAAEAIRKVKAASDAGTPYDTVLLDWIMPEMDGIALAEHIRHDMQLPHRPSLILLSAAHHEDLPDIGVHSPLDKVLSKPITPQQLLEAISTASAGDKSHTSSDPVASRTLAGLSLLVVEDNAFNQTVVRELLLSEGAHVTIASGGEEGVNTVIQGQQSFDMVLMDLQMPDIDGFEATRRIRANPAFATLPIVAMTANVSESDKQNCLAAGMNGHISKPLVFQDVIAVILQISGRQAHAVEAPADTKPPSDQLLQRFGGNLIIYQKLLRAFMPSFSELVNALREARRKEDWPAAMMALHTLKGTTGSVGLDNLYHYIVNSESALKTASEQDKARQLDEVLAQIEALAQEEHRNISELLASMAPPPDVPELTQIELGGLIDELAQSLNSSNMKAVDQAEQLAWQLSQNPAWQPFAEALVQATENLDFNRAKQVLEQIKEVRDVEKNA